MMPDAENQQEAQQAKPMRAPLRLPLVNTIDSRDGSFEKDARLINAYAEKSRLSGEYHVEKRPGFAPLPVITGGGIGQGINSDTIVSTGIGADFRNSGNPAIDPSNYTFITDIVDNIFYETIYQNGILLVPRQAVGPVTINLLGGFPTRANFLTIEGANLALLNTGGAVVTLFGGGTQNWVWTDYPYSNTATQGGPLAYIYTGNVPPAVSHIFRLTPSIGLGVGVPGVGAGYPIATVPGFAVLNGYCYVMDIAGTIYQTATQNDPSNWSGLSIITAASDADRGVQLARQLIYIVAIKSFTTQFFYDAGNAVGSSLSPVPGAMYNVGCLSADTFADLDGILFWVTSSRQGTYQVIMLENLTIKPISTPSIDKFIEAQPTTVWHSMAYQHAGHKFYVLTNATRNKTVVYDIDEKLWYQWTDFQGNFYPFGSRCVDVEGDEWHQDATTGNVYEMDGDYVYSNDHGDVFPVDIYTPNFDAGVDRIKYLSQMRFQADKAAGGSLKVRCSDDDYQTWSNFRTVRLDRKRPILNDCGSFYRRAYHYRHVADAPMRLRSVDIQMDIGVL